MDGRGHQLRSRDPNHAYVTDVYGGRIVVINVDTGEVVHERELTGFDHPWGNEYDSFGGRERLLVTEMRGNLWEVDPATDQRRLLARIDRPGLTSIAIDSSDGNVYVSNGLYGGLYRLDEPARRLVPVLPEGDFAIPTSLNEASPDAALPAGSLWVGDMTAISTLAPNGDVNRILNFQADDYDENNPGDPHWITPSAVQTDKDTVYFPETFFARDGISRLDLKTGKRTFITKPGEVSPYHLRALPDGDLLATEQSLTTTAGRIVHVDPDTSPATTTTIAGDLTIPGGLRYERATNDAYVSEVATGRIWAVNIENGSQTLVVEGLDAPEGLDLDESGGLVVVEGEGARRLLRFALDACRSAACGPDQAETIASN
ncbi:MAG: hypothetical protein M3O70_07470, partial [Actinomycetota bacterium]|nr:hypothetical protein [Actinomycetota bacterium]